jgi:hypothetical protein
MKGYWVKVNQNGLLVISAGAQASATRTLGGTK